MVYSPLEQFEPVSFCSILLNYINLSITNISFMFIFIILVFIFLLNGYFFVFNNNSVKSHLQADINNIENIRSIFNNINSSESIGLDFNSTTYYFLDL